MLTMSQLDASESHARHRRAHLSLLGSWRLTPKDSGPVPPGGQRLLALVALNGRQSRMRAAATLWPDIDDDRASGRLRSLLWRLDKSVVSLLDLSNGDLALSADVTDDVGELEVVACLLTAGKPLDPGMDLDTALAVLVGPELLVGWYDEWVLENRDHVNDLRVHALEVLVDRFIEASRPREALQAARAAMRLDPYRESSQRAAIRALLAEGNPASALRHFERYRAFVRAELGIEQLTEQMMATIGSITGA